MELFNKYKKIIIISSLIIIIFSFGLFISIFFPYKLNEIDKIKSCIESAQGIKLCPQSKSYIKYSQISQNLINAIIVSEDINFYHHRGFDTFEIQESIERNLKTGEFARGGSTITQQLVKNVYLSQEKTLTRKVFEALITLRVENILTKNEILEKYLNVIEFGNNLYGIGTASKYYFQKSPDQLSVLESAFLAMLLPNPKKYSTSFHKKQLSDFAKSRIKDIVSKMLHYQFITQEEYDSSNSKIDQFPWMQFNL